MHSTIAPSALFFAIFGIISIATSMATATTTRNEQRRILMYPANVPSHFLIFSRIGTALTAKGHHVTMLVPNNTRLPSNVNPDIEIKIYDVRSPEPFIGSAANSDFMVRWLEAEDAGMLTWMGMMNEMRTLIQDALFDDCEDLLSNSALVNILSQTKYDLMFYDPMDKVCAPTLGYKLQLPQAMVSLQGLRWFYRVPMMPSISPSAALANTNAMTFTQRAKNLAFEIMYDMMTNTTTYYVEKYVPERPVTNGREIIREAVLWFYLYDDVLHYPSPQMPNTMNIGAIMLHEAKPLPNEYAMLLNQSYSSVILMSLGSVQTHFPSEWVERFCEAFSLLSPDILVIWKMNSPPDCKLPSNVKTKSWLPQNDLLAHPKLKLFITHGGWNSYAEATYHAKPMIGFSLFGDQVHNVVAMEGKGLGVAMKITTFKPKELADNITYILNNDTFTANARKQATLLRQQPIPASEKIAFWVEHVIRFGGDHLRNSGFNLNLFEFLMLDILAVILSVILFIIIAICVFLYVAFRVLHSCCRKKPKQKTA